jgi:hypothetical protein
VLSFVAVAAHAIPGIPTAAIASRVLLEMGGCAGMVDFL